MENLRNESPNLKKNVINQITEFLDQFVNRFKDDESGCATLVVTDRLAVCIGWSQGYGTEKRTDCIQSKSNPDWAINAGIKVWTSDDLRTDFDYINCPYYEDGTVEDITVSIVEEESYLHLAEYFFKEIERLDAFEIDSKGLIVGNK